jgi:hypothetical protein
MTPPMNRLANAHRRRLARGVASRGFVVAVALVGAVALQLAGPRLQCSLASLSGIARVAPATPEPMPPSSPSCGGTARGIAMHPCKLAVAGSPGFTPAI